MMNNLTFNCCDCDPRDRDDCGLGTYISCEDAGLGVFTSCEDAGLGGFSADKEMGWLGSLLEQANMSSSESILKR
jgi:hypothetical protein